MSCHAKCPPCEGCEELERRVAEMVEALKAQHDAIDILFAMLIESVPGFFPTKSGKPWEAMLQGNAVLSRATGERASPATHEEAP